MDTPHQISSAAKNNNIIISAPDRPEPKILNASKYYRLIFYGEFGADSYHMPLYEAAA